MARPTGAVRDDLMVGGDRDLVLKREHRACCLMPKFGLKADAVLAPVRTGDNVFVKTEHRVMLSRVQDFTTAPGKEQLWGNRPPPRQFAWERRPDRIFYLNRL